MQVGDIVEVTNPEFPKWASTVCLVLKITDYIWIMPLTMPPGLNSRFATDLGGFHEESLKVLGHIDVAPERGER